MADWTSQLSEGSDKSTTKRQYWNTIENEHCHKRPMESRRKGQEEQRNDQGDKKKKKPTVISGYNNQYSLLRARTTGTHEAGLPDPPNYN